MNDSPQCWQDQVDSFHQLYSELQVRSIRKNFFIPFFIIFHFKFQLSAPLFPDIRIVGGGKMEILHPSPSLYFLNLFFPPEMNKVGSPCAVLHGATWNRAIIRAYNDDSLMTVEVELVDEGSTVVVPCGSVKMLPLQYLRVFFYCHFDSFTNI